MFKSRKIARKLHEDVAFGMLGAGKFPAHRTIRDFRTNHPRELSELFVQVVRLAREMGLVKLGTIAVDGTKVKANSSRRKAMSYARMLQSKRELTAQIDAFMARAKAAGEAESNEPEVHIPAEIARRETRLAAIWAARVERLDVFNGLLLAPHLDAIFDQEWVKVAEHGDLVVSLALDLSARRALGILEGLRIAALNDGHQGFVYHRSMIFRAELTESPKWLDGSCRSDCSVRRK